MARVKRGTTSRRKHNKLFEQAKGYRMTRSRLVKSATQAVRHAGQYAYAGRRLKKRDMRSLWIVRISEAVKPLGTSYSKFMFALKDKGIVINRKMLAELVRTEPEAFKKIVEQTKA